MLDVQQTLVQMFAEQFRYLLALVVLIVGFVTGFLVGRVNERLLRAVGLPETVEGTSVERTARNLGTSTVEVLARMSSWFIYLVSVLVALWVASLIPPSVLWAQATAIIPRVVIALVVLVIGLILGDKAEILVSERLRGVKVPEIGVIPIAVKYSVVFVAILVALGQIGVAVGALIVLFAGYVAAVIVFTAIATKDLLLSGAAGVYLLLRQPYAIGDYVYIGEMDGIVQEVDVFVTHVEDDDREYVIPNSLVFKNGVVRERN